MIEKKIHNKLSEYTSKEVTVDKKLFNDLKIYGDDIEELIHELSKELTFDEIEFWNSFMRHEFYNPPEIYLNLPKVFYLDLKELLFHFKLEYKDPIKTGKDISVDELIELVKKLVY
ncbi:MAG: Unknown protein [uncultured Sulfurovum sp.]|uniref:Uncharacterized protein n=1 Tax=uncultured Sulfurovum sp. TaxID=269237 RepID=A0A6S6TJC2_9BACT|nr:MAG: Unknown protein [uncultured Sulfurovum sp.]